MPCRSALSLTLIWSNTAYLDEADFLWVGRLELAHWLHGTSWPSAVAYRFLSGSPTIYPPIGALANNSEASPGLGSFRFASCSGRRSCSAGQRWRLIGRTGALIAAALWALSEPAMRLAFATA